MVEGDYIEVIEATPTAESAPIPVRKRHGVGMQSGYGERYDGEWSQDQFDGRGVFTFANGAEYDGQWRAGQYHGQGRLTWPDKSSYDGDWVEGKMHGCGVYTDGNGQIWKGIFHNDTFRNDHGVWIPALQLHSTA